MSTYKEIANTPTVLKPKDVADRTCKGWHESVLRSYNILNKVKYLLEKRTDGEVILELIALMESNEFQPYAWHENNYHEDSGHAGDLKDCPKCRPEQNA